MRISREIVGIGILLLLFIGAAAVMTARDTEKSRNIGQELPPDPSNYNDRASGSKAFFEFVKESGNSASVWRRKWSSLESSGAKILIAVDPQAAQQQQLMPVADDESSVLLNASDEEYL